MKNIEYYIPAKWNNCTNYPPLKKVDNQWYYVAGDEKWNVFIPNNSYYMITIEDYKLSNKSELQKHIKSYIEAIKEMYIFAKIMAVSAHSKQKDKGGNPYIEHLINVSCMVNGYEAKAVAFLHDILEDTGYTEEKLRTHKILSDRVLTAVVCLTHKDNESYDSYLNRVKNNELAKYVKMADIKDNLDFSRCPNLPLLTKERLINKYSQALLYLTP